MVDVVGIGTNSLDFVYQLPAYPLPDSPTAKLRISHHVLSPGGQVTTALCTCASLGLRARYVGAVGDDTNSAQLLEALRQRGVDTAQVVRRRAPNRYAVILLDDRGERVILWDRDPALALAPGDIPDAAFADARVVHLDDVDVEASIDVATRARAAGQIVTSDIEQVTPHTRALIDAVTVAIFDEHVTAGLVPGAPLEDALRTLRTRDDQWLCVTQGRRGATLLAGDRFHTAGAYAVPVVDTTGAGDVFRGGFIHALLRGDAPDAVLRYANAAAAVSCTRLGAIGGVPTPGEIAALLARG